MTALVQRRVQAGRNFLCLVRRVHRARQEVGLRGVLVKAVSKTGDYVFDLRFGVDTCRWARLADLGVPERLRRHGVDYEPTGVRDFRLLMRDAGLPRSGTFVDIGSGKGRVLLLASLYGFDRVVGVELSEELCAVARRNVATFRRRAPQASPVEIVCSDASRYVFDDTTTVFFLFNPFDSVVVEQVLSRIRESIERRPREAYLIYSNAVHAGLVERDPLFTSVETYTYPRMACVVYRCQV